MKEALKPILYEGRVRPASAVPVEARAEVYAGEVSQGRLVAEWAYVSFPWTWVLVVGYLLACRWRKLLLPTFLLHTVVLATRIYILGRPPVANMYETMLYVPWVCVLVALLVGRRLHLAAGLGAAFLLLILRLTGLSANLENVQPVLASQLWLTVHVLMVVGSYGVFLLASVLGHLALLGKGTRYLLQVLYIGTGLLIGGTILGGVWAAQSWGRFWDWDPKESWAFISSCAYLLMIHAHRFKLMGERGLAIGAILGFVAISFTWYGVNFLLGTGLHSYGFGSGGTGLYLLFLLVEGLFLLWRAKSFKRPPI